MTPTGRFVFDEPTADMVRVNDIALALSREHRFANFSSGTVALHSLWVCRLLLPHGRDAQLIGLLHDASEAYLRDIPKPLKDMLPGYRDVETKIQNLIYQKYLGRLPSEGELLVLHDADMEMLSVEGNHLFGSEELADWSCLDGHDSIMTEEEKGEWLEDYENSFSQQNSSNFIKTFTALI